MCEIWENLFLQWHRTSLKAIYYVWATHFERASQNYKCEEKNVLTSSSKNNTKKNLNRWNERRFTVLLTVNFQTSYAIIITIIILKREGKKTYVTCWHSFFFVKIYVINFKTFDGKHCTLNKKCEANVLQNLQVFTILD